MTHTAPISPPQKGLVVRKAHPDAQMPPTPLERVLAAQARADWATVAVVLTEHWTSLLRTSRGALREVVNALPDALLEAQPRWAAARQYLNFAPDDGRIPPARFDFEAAQPNEAGELIDDLAQLTGQTANERAHGRFLAAAVIARTAIEAVKQASSSELAILRPLLPGLRVQWATSLLFAGELREATGEFEAAYGDAVVYDSDRMAMAAAGSIAFIHSITGDLSAARSWLRRQLTHNAAAPAEWGMSGVEPGDAVTVMGVLAEVNLAVDGLRVDDARAWLARDPGDEVAPEQWALRLGVATRIELMFGDPHAQLLRNRAAVRARPPRLSGDGLNGWVLRFSVVGLGVAMNDARAASDALEALEGGEQPLSKQSAMIWRVWMELQSGDTVQAVTSMESVPAGERSLRADVELLAALTVVHLRSGGRERAVELARTLATIVAEQEFDSVTTRLTDDELEMLGEWSGGLFDESRLRRRALANLTEVSSTPDVRLTERERVVLRHLMRGLKHDEIAAIEHVSRNTIKSQARSVFKKLEVTSRDEAVEVGLRHPSLWSDAAL